MKKMLMLAAAFISLTLQAVDLVESFADGKYLPKTWGPVRAMNFTDSETGNFKSAIVLDAAVVSLSGTIKPAIKADEDVTFAFDMMRVDSDSAITIILQSTVKGSKRLAGIVIGGNGAVLVSGPDSKYVYIRRQLAVGKRYRMELV